MFFLVLFCCLERDETRRDKNLQPMMIPEFGVMSVPFCNLMVTVPPVVGSQAMTAASPASKSKPPGGIAKAFGPV
jgi:hypothetical protein